MKHNIQVLREKVANLSAQANHLLNEKGDQSWSAEDQAKFDGFTNESPATIADRPRLHQYSCQMGVARQIILFANACASPP